MKYEKIKTKQAKPYKNAIRSVQESIERIAKQTGTEHFFGNIGYILGLSGIDEKRRVKLKIIE